MMLRLENIIQTEHGHLRIEITSGRVTCDHCGQSSKAPARAQSLANHLYTILGFMLQHAGCQPADQTD